MELLWRVPSVLLIPVSSSSKLATEIQLLPRFSEMVMLWHPSLSMVVLPHTVNRVTISPLEALASIEWKEICSLALISNADTGTDIIIRHKATHRTNNPRHFFKVAHSSYIELTIFSSSVAGKVVRTEYSSSFNVHATRLVFRFLKK